MDCIFCKIVAGELPCDKVFEDENILAFNDLHPAAPVHVLVIPKWHISSANELCETDKELVGDIRLKAAQIARKLGCEQGYKLLNHCGKLGGQIVNHLHFHILSQIEGGRGSRK
jgi:histidine triad (HIT) family protein